jgi:flagellar biosynthesis GTPase FlhF
MNTRKSKPLAKVFWPVLLLSAALALPADIQAAPSHKSRQAHIEKAEKNQKKNQKKALQQQRQVQAQQQAELNRQRAAIQRQATINQRTRAQVQRQAQLQRQAELNRQAELQRQRQLALQRQAELNRQAELRRRVELQRRSTANRYRYDDRYRNDDRYRYDDRYYATQNQNQYQQGGTIVVDGYLTNEGYRCQALRDDNGELYMLVGNTYGLGTGDHARVVGRVVDGDYCDWEGTAFEITDVKALWADRRHQSVYYHHNYDGESFGHRDNWVGRRPRLFQNRIR